MFPCAEYKKARQEIKKKSSDTLKLQKKAKKGNGTAEAHCLFVHQTHSPYCHTLFFIFILKIIMLDKAFVFVHSLFHIVQTDLSPLLSQL